MIVLLSALLLSAPTAPAIEPPPMFVVEARDVAVGDPLRRRLLDALRPTIQRDIGQPVQFMVDHLRVDGDWAFFMGGAQRPDGGEIDFSRTRYREAVEEGFFDAPGVMALLRRSPDGSWRVVEFAVGATDMPFESWAADHGAPLSLIR
jgi:hypothetical protein